MISPSVIRNKDVQFGIDRLFRYMHEGKLDATPLIGQIGFTLPDGSVQLLHVTKAEIISRAEFLERLHKPRICVGVEITKEIAEHLEQLTGAKKALLARELSAEAVQIGLPLSSVPKFYDLCFEVLGSPETFTNIPDIDAPYTQKR